MSLISIQEMWRLLVLRWQTPRLIFEIWLTNGSHILLCALHFRVCSKWLSSVLAPTLTISNAINQKYWITAIIHCPLSISIPGLVCYWPIRFIPSAYFFLETQQNTRLITILKVSNYVDSSSRTSSLNMTIIKKGFYAVVACWRRRFHGAALALRPREFHIRSGVWARVSLTESPDYQDKGYFAAHQAKPQATNHNTALNYWRWSIAYLDNHHYDEVCLHQHFRFWALISAAAGMVAYR